MKSLHAVVLLSFVVLYTGFGETLDPEECTELGFNNGALQCSDCDVLGDVSGSAVIALECRRCCADRSDEKYELAVLQLDSRYASRLPNLAEILKHVDSLDVVVRNSLGARPSLLMYKERSDDMPSSELNVFSWTLDTFKEYIEDHKI